MSEETGAELQEEPQAERGREGSRDTGADGPGGGPAGRPSDTADHDSDTGVKPDGSKDDDAPNLQSGGG